MQRSPATGTTVDQQHPQKQARSGGANHTPAAGQIERSGDEESAWDCQRFVRRPSRQDAGVINPGLALKGANPDYEGSRRMQPSDESRGTTRVTVLPDATRREMLAAAGLSESAHWRELDYMEQGVSFNEACDLAAADEAEARGFLVDGGWHVIDPTKGADRGKGTFSHRGVLQRDEHIDEQLLHAAVERELGFAIEQVHSVYRAGRLTEIQRELRGQIDARLLALSRAGGNMAALARIFGWAYDASREAYETMERAIARARQAEVTS